MPSLPIPGRKRRQMPRQGFPRGGGGMFKLPFDWYIILDIIEYSVLFIFSGDDGM